MPTRGSDGAAGWDLYATHDTTIFPQSFGTVHTGVQLELEHHCAVVSHRSGHNARDGIQVYGLIDPDYRGEILVSIHNRSIAESFQIKKGERIAQMRFVEVPEIKLRQVEKLNETNRAQAGHGSTGK